MKIVNLQQRDDKWLKWRKEGVTATDSVVLLNRSPYKTRWRLWAEKTGYAREVDLSMNPLVRRGVQNEDKARQAFEQKIDDILLPVCVESTKHQFLRASLDGLTSNDEPVEMKCPSESVWNDVCKNGVNSEAYELYYAQVQHQMLTIDATSGWLVFYFNGQIMDFVIFPDLTMQDEILKEAVLFLEEVESKKEPVKDPEKDLFIPGDDEASRWISAAESYRIYDSRIKELETELKTLKESQKPFLEDMKAMMGEYCYADYAGLMITRYKAAGRVDYKKLLEDKAVGLGPDEEDKYRAPSGERCRVTVTGSVKPRYIADEDVLAPLEGLSEEVESCFF